MVNKIDAASLSHLIFKPCLKMTTWIICGLCFFCSIIHAIIEKITHNVQYTVQQMCLAKNFA